jgi:hypothetical protein
MVDPEGSGFANVLSPVEIKELLLSSKSNGF